ncbi:MAG: 4Fe-4S dicluster domain-containing protein [Nitrospiraceae bacterium]|nr:4Fe-4S dicluster domain-containing protein [Nitrospiraceae bacterium]
MAIKGTLKKSRLENLLAVLNKSHRVIGPKAEDGAVVMAEIGYKDIPSGVRDLQWPGGCRLLPGKDSQVFSFSPGPDSFKRFLHPPVSELFAFKRNGAKIDFLPAPKISERPMAFFAVRPCDLSALKLYDKIFLGGPVADQAYESLRRGSLVVALNCLYPGNNCFCLSMGTGPEARDGFDIQMTELEDSFLLEDGSAKGAEILEQLPLGQAGADEISAKRQRIESCKAAFKKSIAAQELPGMIYANLDHPHWEDIARRDLECGNCTQVCPTCFCNTSYDYAALGGIAAGGAVSGKRLRKWDSCFSRSFARVHSGNFRFSRKARYRHWMAHKLAYTQAQFGLPGCVGCGRCITWCPAGIDITAELEALRHV